MQFKKKAKIITSDFWYDLFENYIKLEKLLKEPEDIDEIQRAIETLKNFRDSADAQGILEED
jgi:hypothetical protein